MLPAKWRPFCSRSCVGSTFNSFLHRPEGSLTLLTLVQMCPRTQHFTFTLFVICFVISSHLIHVCWIIKNHYSDVIWKPWRLKSQKTISKAQAINKERKIFPWHDVITEHSPLPGLRPQDPSLRPQISQSLASAMSSCWQLPWCYRQTSRVETTLNSASGSEMIEYIPIGNWPLSGSSSTVANYKKSALISSLSQTSVHVWKVT